MRQCKTNDSIPIEGIILAAGLSSRAGNFKMALTLGDKPLLKHTLDAFPEYCRKIVVVTGHRPNIIEDIVALYPKVQIAHNLDFNLGMFSSIKEGVKYIESPYFFVVPGDYPFIKRQTFDLLWNVAKNSSDYSVFIPVFKERKGHPILLNSSLISSLIFEPEDSTLRHFIRRQNTLLVPVDDEGILLDIDTPEDFALCLSKISKSNE